jgi:SAM-dependent methyltransferase
MSAPEVYPTARGPLPRLVDPLARRARARRHTRFLELVAPAPSMRIVDIGCGSAGLRGLAPELDVTGVDLVERLDYPGPFVCADASERLPFADGEFDLAYSNSVIEHVSPGRRATFAAELHRVARGWYVQTPARSFPLEPHSLLPAAHWLPSGLRRRYWRLGAMGDWEDIALLSRGEFEALFGPVERERFGPLTKSWVAISPPPGY